MTNSATVTVAGSLDSADAHLVRVAAAVAACDTATIRSTLAAAAIDAPPAAVEEVLLQSHLFAGFPRAINALTLWRELVPDIATPDTDSASAAASMRARGEATCRTVYDATYDRLRENVRRLHPALDRWMVEHGYGETLSRPGLDLRRRELCIVAACAAAEQLPQLRSHLRGAVACGATSAELRATFDALEGIVGAAALATARGALDAIHSTPLSGTR